MRDDNTEPRDNQQIADDNQQSGTAGPRDVEENITNRSVDEDVDEEDEDALDEEEEEFD